MTEITRTLSAMERGDAHAAEQLLPLVYEELRKLAAQRLAQERPGQTLQPTALVHEAYLRLVAGAPGPEGNGPAQAWQNRAHFFAAAAEAMRRILIDKAREKGRRKRGGELSVEEAAEMLGLARSTAYEHWAYARAWVLCHLRDNQQ